MKKIEIDLDELIRECWEKMINDFYETDCTTDYDKLSAQNELFYREVIHEAIGMDRVIKILEEKYNLEDKINKTIGQEDKESE